MFKKKYKKNNKLYKIALQDGENLKILMKFNINITRKDKKKMKLIK